VEELEDEMLGAPVPWETIVDILGPPESDVRKGFEAARRDGRLFTPKPGYVGSRRRRR